MTSQPRDGKRDEITLRAALEHLGEFYRLIEGLPKELQSQQLALSSLSSRIRWRELNHGKKITKTTYEQLQEMSKEVRA